MSQHDPNDYRDSTGNLTREAINNFARDVARSGQPAPQTVNNLSNAERQYFQNDFDHARKQSGT